MIKKLALAAILAILAHAPAYAANDTDGLCDASLSIIGNSNFYNTISGCDHTFWTGISYSAISGYEHTFGTGAGYNSVSGRLHTIWHGSRYNFVTGYGHTLGTLTKYNVVGGYTNSITENGQYNVLLGKGNAVNGLFVGDGGDGNVLLGNGNTSTGNGNFVAMGARATGLGIIAIGNNAFAEFDDSIALGSYSVTSYSGNTASAVVSPCSDFDAGGVSVAWCEGTNAHWGEMNIGRRLLTGVADGRIGLNSWDAINGHQLYQVATDLGAAITANAASIQVNASNISNGSPTDLTEVWDAIDTNETAISNHETSISNHETSISNNTAATSINATDISTNTTSTETNATDIAVNASDIETNKGDIKTNKTNIAEHDTRISNIDTQLAVNISDIGINRAGISENRSNFAMLNDRVDDHDLRLDTNEAAISSLHVSLEALDRRAMSGIAISNALDPVLLQKGSKGGIRLGVGFYGGKTALALSGAVRVHRSVSLDFGVGLSGSQVGGKGGVTYQW